MHMIYLLKPRFRLLLILLPAILYFPGLAQTGDCLEIKSFGPAGGGETFCSGETLTLVAEVELDPGASIISYTWYKDGDPVGTTITSNRYQINSVSAQDAGDWHVRVRAFCQLNIEQVNSTPFAIEVNLSPEARIGSDGENELNCEQRSLTLTAENAPGNAQFAWSAPGFTASSRQVEINEGATYRLQVTANGCTSEDFLAIDDYQDFEPLASAGADVVLERCGQNITLDASGSTNGGRGNLRYEWTGPGFTYSGGNAKVQVNDAQPGVYSLRVLNQLSRCTDTDEVMLDGSNLALPNADAGEDQTLTCREPELTLGGSGSTTGPDISYSWSAREGGNIVSGGNAANAVVDRPGAYELTVRNTATECAVSAAVSVDENKTPPEVSISPGQNPFFCSGKTLTLEAVGDADTWIWSTGDSGPSLEVSQADLYVLEGTREENGCFELAEVNVEERPTPVISAPDTTLSVAAGTEIVFPLSASPPGADLTWTLSSRGNLDESNSDYLESGTGNITGRFVPLSDRSPAGLTYLAYASLRECFSDTSQIVLLARPGSMGLFIPEVFTPNGDGVNDEWRILLPEGASPDAYSLRIFDRRGRVVVQRDDLSVPWNGSDVADGVYFYAIVRKADEETVRGAVAIVGKDSP